MSKIGRFHCFFSPMIWINSIASGNSPRTPYTRIFQFLQNFREKFDKIFKRVWKLAIYFIEIIKTLYNFLWFLKNFGNYSGIRPSDPPTQPPPLQALPWWTLLPQEKFLRSLMNCIYYPRIGTIFNWCIIMLIISYVCQRAIVTALAKGVCCRLASIRIT